MSLINKMLQDLEERRSAEEVAGALQGQLRAVPQARRTHIGWWIVLGFMFIATGVGSWLWGRQTVPVAVVTQPASAPALPLKLIASENVPLSEAQKSKIEQEIGVSASTPLPASIIETPDLKGVENGKANAAIQDNVANLPAAVPSPQLVTAPAASTPASTVNQPALAVSSAAPKLPVQLAAAPAKEKPVTSLTAQPEKAPTEKTSAFDIPAHVTKQIKELTPQQRSENEYDRATVLIQQSRNGEAISALEQALQLDPQHVTARQTLAGLLLESNRQGDAIRKLQEGLAIDKGEPALAMMLARLQVEKGDVRPAIETLQRTLPYAVERADYQAFLAALLQRDGRHKETISHYLVALRKVPHNGLWWMGLGMSLQAENRLPEAREAFGRARASNNLSPELLAFVEQKLEQLR